MFNLGVKSNYTIPNKPVQNVFLMSSITPIQLFLLLLFFFLKKPSSLEIDIKPVFIEPLLSPVSSPTGFYQFLNIGITCLVLMDL